MQKYVNQLYRKYLKELRVVDRSRTPRSGVGNSEMGLSRVYFQKLERYIATEGFKNEAEEILFFKTLLPRFHGLYIFHLKMEIIEQHFLTEQLTHKKLFLNRVLKLLNRRVKRYADFCERAKRNIPVIDRRHFLRSKVKVKIPDEYTLLKEHPLCTTASLKLAEVIAYNLLLDYWGDLAMVAKHGGKSTTIQP